MLNLNQITPTVIESFTDYGSIIRNRAETQGDDLAYTFLENGINETASYTFSTLDYKAKSIAAYLQNIGAKRERVLIVMQSDLDYSMAFFGCLYAGATAVTTITPSTPEQVRRLGHVVKNANAKFVITKRNILDKLEARIAETEELKNIHWIIYDEIEVSKSVNWVEPNLNWNDIALLQYTSGSTASPKGVQVSHRNLGAIGHYHEEIFGMNQNDFGVTWLPQSHDMGLVFGILQSAFTGYPTCVMTPTAFLKKPIRWLKALSNYSASVSIVPNFAFDLCVENVKEEDFEDLDLSNFTLAANGAEPVQKSTLEKFTRVFARAGFNPSALGGAYGLAESTLAVTSTRRDEKHQFRSLDVSALEKGIALDVKSIDQKFRDVVSCGKPGNSVELRIVDPETLATLPRDKVGEILIKGPMTADGYWNNSIVTNSTFNVFTKEQTGPFLRTGDLGFLDEKGELYITGRQKDLIISQGKNHSPFDIELTAENCNPAIRPRQVSAFSFEAIYQEVVVVIAEIRRSYLKNVDPVKLGKEVMQKIVKEHQIPVFETLFVKRGECPKTTSGKIQRQRSKQMYLKKEFTVVGSFRNPMFKNLAV